MLPLVPLMALFDGLVSCLRTYSPDELVEPLRGGGYVWTIGRVRSWRSPVPITYLIGHPG